MSIADLIFDFGAAVQIFLCSAFFCPNKNKFPKKLLALPAACGMQFIMELLLQQKAFVTDVICGIVELFGVLLILGIFNSENVFKNYVINILTILGSNLVASVVYLVNPRWSAALSGQVLMKDCSLSDVTAITILLILITIPVGFIISKLMHAERPGNVTVYKYVVTIFLAASLSSYIVKKEVVQDYLANMNNPALRNALTVLFFIGNAIIWVNICLFLYNKSEKRRLQKEKLELLKLINSNYEQYNKLVSENQELQAIKTELDTYKSTQNDITSEKVTAYVNELANKHNAFPNIGLSGNLAIDGIITKHYTSCSDDNIIFEANLSALNANDENIMSIASLLNTLTEMAIMLAKASNEKQWLLINTNSKAGTTTISYEFSKTQNTKLPKNINKHYFKGVNSKELNAKLKLAKAIVNTYGGQLLFEQGTNEAKILLMIKGN